MRTPNVLSIAGLDPSGGAGVLADVKAMSALGAYGMAVIAALTAQNTQGVSGIHAVPPAFVAQQIDTLFADVTVHAVKIGMLGQASVTRTVAERLAHWQPAHLVLDPVMIAKSGDTLLEAAAIAQLRDSLLPLASVITPNLPEAAVLIETSAAQTPKEMRRCAERLRRLMADDGQRWVFLKGGHLPGDELTDLLFDGDKMIELPGRRIHTANTHGTGCTLSAALAALLPQTNGFVPTAAQRAHDYLATAIAHADALDVGSGHGPVQHFHAWWGRA